MSGIDFSIGSATGDSTTDYEYSEANVLEIMHEEREPSFEESQRIQNKNLSERISKAEHGIYTCYSIDNVVRVKTLSNYIIKQKIDFWNERKVSARNHAIFGAVAAVVGAFFGFTAQSPFGFVVGICGLGYGIYKSSYMKGASKEIASWKQDPVKEIADQRLAAFKNGLIYIYKQDSSGQSRPHKYQQILSKNELQGFYNQYFHQFKGQLASAHEDRSKLVLLSEAARYSPLASHVYRYALLPQEKIDQMEEIRMRYNEFLKAYNSVDGRIKIEVNRIKESFKVPIEMVQKEKVEVLKPIDERYAAAKKMLLDLKTGKLEGQPPTGVEIPDYHRQVEREFAERYKAAEQTYNKEKEETLKEPNEKLQELEAKKKELLSRIQNDRSAQLLPLFPYAQALHQEAFKLYKGDAYDLRRLHHDPEAVFSTYPNRYGPMPRPSAPPMNSEVWSDYTRYNIGQEARRY